MTPNQYTPEEPISSIATALAPAALGIVRVSGKGCIELVSKVFSRPKALLSAAGNTLVYGWIIEKGESSTSGEAGKIDEVMLAVYRAPKSFTGEDMVEIFCHGGPAGLHARRADSVSLPDDCGEGDIRASPAVVSPHEGHDRPRDNLAVPQGSGRLRSQALWAKRLAYAGQAHIPA